MKRTATPHRYGAIVPASLWVAAALALASCQTGFYEHSVTPYQYSGVRLYQALGRDD